MRRMGVWMGMLLVLSGTGGARAWGEVAIQPFANVQWHDTLVEVVHKLNAMDTVTHVHVVDESSGSVDVHGLAGKEQIVRKLARSLSEKALKTYAGVDKKVFDDTLLLMAQPIVFLEMEFSLIISYSTSLDLIIENREKVDILRHGGEEYYLPLRMVHVVLSKLDDSVFDEASLQALMRYVRATYQGLPIQYVDSDEMRVSDGQGRTFFVRYKPAGTLRETAPGYTGSCMLQYGNRTPYPLDGAYKRYIADIKKSK